MKLKMVLGNIGHAVGKQLANIAQIVDFHTYGLDCFSLHLLVLAYF